jgi:hypothetical protein
MKNHITSVLEFQEIGIVLEGPDRHVVRVMGALKVVHPPDLPVAKEDLSVLVDRAPFDPYYAGEAPKEEPSPQEEPQVPPLFVTREGKVVFLGREVEDLA